MFVKVIDVKFEHYTWVLVFFFHFRSQSSELLEKRVKTIIRKIPFVEEPTRASCWHGPQHMSAPVAPSPLRPRPRFPVVLWGSAEGHSCQKAVTGQHSVFHQILRVCELLV